MRARCARLCRGPRALWLSLLVRFFFLRRGGLVQPGSFKCGDGTTVTFEVADGSAKMPVAYKGLLPDLFREGQGVVAEGALDSAGTFRADSVLAKHDETYMPKDVA